MSRKQKQKKETKSSDNIAEELKPENVFKEEKKQKQKKKEKEKEKLMEELAKNCYDVRYLVVCKDDVVNVKVGRYWWTGKVLKVGNLGITVLNGAKLSTIALNKIASITILEEGEYKKKYKKLFKKVINDGVE